MNAYATHIEYDNGMDMVPIPVSSNNPAIQWCKTMGSACLLREQLRKAGRVAKIDKLAIYPGEYIVRSW